MAKSKCKYVFDIETNGLLDTVDKLHSIVLKDIDTGEVKSYADAYRKDGFGLDMGLAVLRQANGLVGFNSIRFDLPVLNKLHPLFKFNQVHTDLLVCSRLMFTDMARLDSSSSWGNKSRVPKDCVGRHSLKSWGYRLGVLKGDFSDTSDFSEWSPEMQTYCVRDVEITYLLWKLVESKNYSGRALDLEHAFAELIADQEDNGFGFNVEAAGELYGKLVKDKEQLRSKLIKEIPPSEVKMKSPDHWIDSTTDLRYNTIKDARLSGVKRGDLVEGPKRVKTYPFNPTSRQQVSDLLKNKYGWKPTEYTSDGHAKVDEKVLSSLAYPPAKDISKLFLIEKRIGQLAEGEQAWLRLVKDGRIHGGCNTNGAVSGRVTHIRPNLATVPRVGNPYGKECRSLFVPRSGNILCGFDASSLELRCAAHYLYPYDGGKYVKTVTEQDPHVVNQKAAGLATRDQSKLFIYALIYGAGYQKLGSIVDSSASDSTQVAIGKGLKKKFFANMPSFKSLISAIKGRFELNGYLKGLDGRKLRIRSEHSAPNLLFQSAGAILMKKTLINFHDLAENKGLRHTEDYWLVVNVHDEFQWECRSDSLLEERATTLGEIAKRAMTKAGEDFDFRCPLTGEYRLGKNWAETH